MVATVVPSAVSPQVHLSTLAPDVVAAPPEEDGFMVITPPIAGVAAFELATPWLTMVMRPAVVVWILATYLELGVVDSQPKPFAAAGIDGWVCTHSVITVRQVPVAKITSLVFALTT